MESCQNKHILKFERKLADFQAMQLFVQGNISFLTLFSFFTF